MKRLLIGSILVLGSLSLVGTEYGFAQAGAHTSTKQGGGGGGSFQQDGKMQGSNRGSTTDEK
jgi:hypothetical protein